MERTRLRLPHPLLGQPAETELATPEEMRRWGEWLVSTAYHHCTDGQRKAEMLRENPWLRKVKSEGKV